MNDEQLFERLDTATATVTGIRVDLQRQIDTSKMAIVLAISVAVVAGLVNFVLFLRVWQQADELRDLQMDRAVEECVRGNQNRGKIIEAFDLLLAQVRAPADPAEAVDQKQRIDAFRAGLRHQLGPQDCSPEAVTPPTTA